MKPRPVLGDLLNIDVNLVNNEQEGAKDCFAMGDSTFRHDGFSIGKDYMRLEGRTVCRGELLPTSLVIDDLIGQGAFSKVHRGTWSKKNETIKVAVKQFCLMESSEQRRDMLLKELRALCKVDCKCLVRFHGAFLDYETVTMVLEYMDMGSLEHLLAKKKSSLNEAFIAAMSYQMFWGLAYLHHERIIHRDIKPGNVLLHSSGQIKLCDFGIVSLSDKTMQTTVVGTTRYMAPERLRAQPYGRSSDVWSAGLVILECLTGECPWKDSDSIVSLLVTVEETATKDIIPDSASSVLQEFLMGCLNQLPEKRIPAKLLLKSPWFAKEHHIQNISDAVRTSKQTFSKLDSL